MKKILFLIVSIFLIPALCWSQGQITRQKKTELPKKEALKQTQPSKSKEKQSVENNNSETINGITVHWSSDVTSAQKSAITTLLNNMVYVQGGSFMMGSNDSEAMNDEKPVHRETVSSFHIDKYEVTQELWQAVEGYNPSHFKGENLPVENVSWSNCQNFIEKLNKLTGLSFRLPTEAEWEYAARGGNKSKGYKYSGSNTIGNVGWYQDNSNNKTHSVGTKSSNELGLYDMSGNVWEWTSDKYSSDYNSPRNKEGYVNRGGSWGYVASFSRVSKRYYIEKYYSNSYLGFRLVL